MSEAADIMTVQPEQGNGKPDRLHFPSLCSDAEWDLVCERFGLTPRERQVMDFLCRGFGYTELCTRLRIARPTLRTHLRSAYEKLGCTRAIEAVLLLIHGGSLDGPPEQEGGEPAEEDR